MTHEETVLLTRYVKACCPQQAIDKYTPVAWHDLLGHLGIDDCRAAVAAVASRQPFVAPAEIIAEVRRTQAHAKDQAHLRELLDPDAHRAAITRADDAFMRKLAARTGEPLALRTVPEPDYGAAQ